MMEQRVLLFTIDADMVSTLGLAEVGRPDLGMRATSLAEQAEARAILFWLGSYVISTGARLRAGEILEFENGHLRLVRRDASRLEVVPPANVQAGTSAGRVIVRISPPAAPRCGEAASSPIAIAPAAT